MPLLPGSPSRCPSRINSFLPSALRKLYISSPALPCPYYIYSVSDSQHKELECLFDYRLLENRDQVYNICMYSTGLMNVC